MTTNEKQALEELLMMLYLYGNPPNRGHINGIWAAVYALCPEAADRETATPEELLREFTPGALPS